MTEAGNCSKPEWWDCCQPSLGLHFEGDCGELVAAEETQYKARKARW